MITILPMADERRKGAILSRYPYLRGQGDVMVMAEKAEELGTVVLSVDGNVLRMYDLTVAGQKLEALDGMGQIVADSLMRAAASYGETKGARQVVSHVKGLEGFLMQKGFHEEDGDMVTKMSNLIHRCKPGAQC